MDSLNEKQTGGETTEIRQEVGLNILYNVAAFNISSWSSLVEIGKKEVWFSNCQVSLKSKALIFTGYFKMK
jgi:hypothetical protein